MAAKPTRDDVPGLYTNDNAPADFITMQVLEMVRSMPENAHIGTSDIMAVSDFQGALDRYEAELREYVQQDSTDPVHANLAFLALDAAFWMGAALFRRDALIAAYKAFRFGQNYEAWRKAREADPTVKTGRKTRRGLTKGNKSRSADAQSEYETLARASAH